MKRSLVLLAGVVHQHDAVGALVVRLRDDVEVLLPSGVPHLALHALALDVQHFRLVCYSAVATGGAGCRDVPAGVTVPRCSAAPLHATQRCAAATHPAVAIMLMLKVFSEYRNIMLVLPTPARSGGRQRSVEPRESAKRRRRWLARCTAPATGHAPASPSNSIFTVML